MAKTRNKTTHNHRSKENDPIWKQVHLYETVGVAGYARK
jgi:hypothetical protein